LRDLKAHGFGKLESLNGKYFYNGHWLDNLKSGEGEEIVLGSYNYKGYFLKDRF